MKLTSLTEAVFGESPKIDKEAGVIYGVKCLGKVSRNGREYSDQALKDCAGLYEGVQINMNHPTKKEMSEDRRFEDGVGWLKNVRIEEGGVYGDLHYLKSHPYSSVLVEATERNPSRFGLSHNADGSLIRKQNKNVVESVSRVRSLDLVQNPATNCGLFESEEPETVERNRMKRTLKQLVETVDPKNESRAVLTKLMEMDSVSPDMTLPDYHSEPDGDETGSAGDADEQAKLAFNAMVTAVCNDDSMDLKAKVARIKDILTAQDKLLNPADPTAEPDGDEGDGESNTTEGGDPMSESLKKQNLEHATELLEAAGIATPSKAQVNAVALAETSADRKLLIESWKPKAEPVEATKAKKPAFTRLKESFAPSGDDERASYPKDSKSFVRAIKSNR